MNLKPKQLTRAIIVILCFVELFCILGTSPGNRPNGLAIRQRLLELSKSHTSENEARLQEEIAKADTPYRRIRIYAWWGLGLNTLAIIAAICVLRKWKQE
jgi:hypothetical protein